MPSPGRMGRNFIAPLSVGILFGFGFAYVLLNINMTSVQRSAMTFFQPQQRWSATEAQSLSKEVRVLCWIMTTPANHQKKAIHVKRTWGQRCNKLLFMSSTADPELPSIGLKNLTEGRNHLWGKTKEAFKYVYENHFDEADWFMKADDDTFVVVENLRLMLKEYNPNYPIYFGCKLKRHVKQGFMSGGAGYVLSKEALRKLIEEAIPNKKKCRQAGHGDEDVEMGKCLQNVGVEAGDSRDEYGRFRFLPSTPERIVPPNPPSNINAYENSSYYPKKEGLDCCSDTAVSFHRISPSQMYVLEYLLYHLSPYGINMEKAISIEPITATTSRASATVKLSSQSNT